MVTMSRRLPFARPTQTSTVAPTARRQADSLLRDLAFVLHLTEKVKRQIGADQEKRELALAGASE